jgi:hypothetical protein
MTTVHETVPNKSAAASSGRGCKTKELLQVAALNHHPLQHTPPQHAPVLLSARRSCEQLPRMHRTVLRCQSDWLTACAHRSCLERKTQQLCVLLRQQANRRPTTQFRCLALGGCLKPARTVHMLQCISGMSGGACAAYASLADASSAGAALASPADSAVAILT